jgi:hypothetical protein
MIISKYIRNWLCQGVSEEINRLVVSFRLRSHFADEYIEALKQTLRKPGHLAAFQDCVDLWTMRRNQHYTDLELVEAFLNQYAKVPQRVTISPFFLSQVVMNEIRYDNTRMAAARHMNYDKTYADVEEFSATDLFKLLKELINELKTVETFHAAASIET